jgi:hypothetical protein
MREIEPGLFHWTAFHDGIGQTVSSYYVREARVLIDPMVPPEGLEWLAENGPPETILLTNRHHYRHSGRIVEAFGAVVRASRPGMHEFAPEQRVEPFDFGDELPGDITAHEVAAPGWIDETALEISGVGAIACADGVVRAGMDGALTFVPDPLLGDDPEEVKRGLRASYRRLVEGVEFEHLLLAHGLPLVGDGKERLREFVGTAD